MTTKDVIRIADAAYPDGFVLRYYLTKPSGRKVGDTLALFIAREIESVVTGVVDNKEKFVLAERAILTAARELVGVAKAIGEYHRSMSRALKAIAKIERDREFGRTGKRRRIQ